MYVRNRRIFGIAGFKIARLYCSYIFFTRDWFSMGLVVQEINEKKDFECSCGRSYKQKITLVRHQRYECGTLPKFPCHLCSYRAKHKGHLASHMRNRHSVRSEKFGELATDLQNQSTSDELILPSSFIKEEAL